MDKHALAELIRRYRSGTATEQEKDLLENIWNNAMDDTTALDSLSKKERQALKANMFAETRRRIEAIEAPVRTRYIHPWMAVAATVALLITASVLLYWNAHRMIEIHTGFGQQQAIVLPDNSQITLNGNSVLRYYNTWDEHETREVWIDGEGFFSVQHTKNDQKFIVHASKQLDVQVLGTKFNVKSRDQRSEVMLTEGKVRLDLLNSDEAPVFLKPGELATMDNQVISKRAVKQKKYTSWLNYTILFDRTPLSEVAALLKDTYGLEVTFTDENLKNRELSGEISSASASEILYAIAETFNLNVERQDQHVTMSSK